MALQMVKTTVVNFLPVRVFAASVPGELYAWRFVAGLNGYNLQIGNNTPLASYAAKWGEPNGIFNKFANLFETYRVSRIRITFEQSVSQVWYITEPVISWIDPLSTGSQAPTYANALQEADSAPQPKFGRTAMMQSLDYRQWLVQTQERPYLKTINVAGTDREEYDEGDVSRSPAIKMAQYFSPLGLVANPLKAGIGILRCEVEYEFRGRRLETEQLPTLKDPFIQLDSGDLDHKQP